MSVTELADGVVQAYDHLTPTLFMLAPALSQLFYPHSLHRMAAVSRAFQRWTAEQLPVVHRSEERKWQRERAALMDSKWAMNAARSALSAEEAQRLDAAVKQTWHRFADGCVVGEALAQGDEAASAERGARVSRADLRRIWASVREDKHYKGRPDDLLHEVETSVTCGAQIVARLDRRAALCIVAQLITACHHLAFHCQLSPGLDPRAAGRCCLSRRPTRRKRRHWRQQTAALACCAW